MGRSRHGSTQLGGYRHESRPRVRTRGHQGASRAPVEADGWTQVTRPLTNPVRFKPTDRRLGEGTVIGIALAADRRRDAGGHEAIRCAGTSWKRSSRAMLVRATSARHRIRHGIRHTAAGAGGRSCPCVANGRLRHLLIGYARGVTRRRLRDALALMTGAVHSSKRWPRPHAPSVSLRRIGECLKHMIALGGVMAFKSSGW